MSSAFSTESTPPPSSLPPRGGAVEIHSRRALGADGTLRLRQLVLCPTREAWTSLDACRHCPACLHVSTTSRIEDSLLLCESGPTDDHEDDKPVRHRLATLARDRVVDALDDQALTVEAATLASVLARVLRETGADGAVVVDTHDQPVGAITTRDLTSDRAEVSVGSIMSEPAVTLLDRATVADGIAVVGSRRQAFVPVLSCGRLVGVLTPRGILAWLARRRSPRATAARGFTSRTSRAAT